MQPLSVAWYVLEPVDPSREGLGKALWQRIDDIEPNREQVTDGVDLMDVTAVVSAMLDDGAQPLVRPHEPRVTEASHGLTDGLAAHPESFNQFCFRWQSGAYRKASLGDLRLERAKYGKVERLAAAFPHPCHYFSLSHRISATTASFT